MTIETFAPRPFPPAWLEPHAFHDYRPGNVECWWLKPPACEQSADVLAIKQSVSPQFMTDDSVDVHTLGWWFLLLSGLVALAVMLERGT